MPSVQSIAQPPRRYRDLGRSIVSQAAVILGDQFADCGVQRQVRDHAERHAENMSKLASAIRVSHRVARRPQNTVLTSFSASLCSVMRAAHELGQHLTFQQVEDLARTRPHEETGEPVRVKLTRGRRDRLTLDFGLRRRAQQYHVRDVLDVSLNLSLHDYSVRGRGTHRAVAVLVNRINQGGAEWVATGDITNCFGTFSQEGVINRLRLPEQVVRVTVLLSEGAQLVMPGSLDSESTLRLRMGLPQGSRLSNLVSSSLLKEVFNDLASEYNSVAYVDDFAAACYTEEEAHGFLEALSGALAAHPCGPLTLGHRCVGHVSQVPSFLGYELDADDDLKVRARPSQDGLILPRFSGHLC